MRYETNNNLKKLKETLIFFMAGENVVKSYVLCRENVVFLNRYFSLSFFKGSS